MRGVVFCLGARGDGARPRFAENRKRVAKRRILRHIYCCILYESNGSGGVCVSRPKSEVAMNFEKKLIILTGKEGKGTALIEQNGLGVFLLLNVFSLPDLGRGEYALGIKTGTLVLSRELGSLGRIRTRMQLPEGDYSAVHLVVFTTADDRAVLYGTAAKRRMWEGNLMDGLRRNQSDEKTLEPTKAGTPPQTFAYSERKIEDYFLDIRPGTPYADNAVAETNYYAFPAMSATPADDEESDAPRALPSEMERAYLSKRFSLFSATPTAFPASDAPSALQLLADTESIAATLKEPLYSYYDDLPNAEKTDDGEKEKSVMAGTEAEKSRPIRKADDYTVEEAVSSVKTSADFYTRVKPQIDKLFKSGQPFPPLESALPNTKWVRVDYDERGRYYLVGLIGEAPDYLAYGVPGAYASSPLEGADFIPEKADTPTGNGYWVLFQSARTGEEIVKKP